MPFINGLLKKKGIGQMVNYCYLHFGLEITVKMLDQVKNLGFKYATKAGLSIGIDDMVIPADKAKLVNEAEQGGHRRHAAVSRRRHHLRRTLQQSGRDLVGRHGKSGRRRCSAACRRPTSKATSTPSTSWPTPALADRNSRSASSPVCADLMAQVLRARSSRRHHGKLP